MQHPRHKLVVGWRRKPVAIVAASLLMASGAATAVAVLAPAASAAEPATSLHYAANSNFDSSGSYVPGTAGFNLADVGSASQASSLPSGVKGLAYVGLCNGVDSTFTSQLTPYIGNSKTFGFYLMDEPDPTGQWNPLCPAANLKAESDWIHTNIPGAKTFIMLMNMSASSSPTYANTYTPSNSHVDLFGLDPYPCRTELNGCDYSYITKGVAAAQAAGIPLAQIVPTYQGFGGGAWTDDGGGAYQLPTATQEQQILATWGSVVPSPAFDYVYSWGAQNGDTAVAQSPSLQQVFAAHNAGTTSTPSPTTSPTTSPTASPTPSPTTSPTTSPTPSPTTSPSSSPPPAPAGAKFRQATAFDTGSRVTSTQVKLGQPVAAGDLLVGWFAQYNASGRVQVSDNVNGAWTRGPASTSFGGQGDIALYYVANAKSAPSGVTITTSASARAYLQGSVSDYSGVAASAPLDQMHVARGTGTVVDSGATASTAAGDLVFGSLVTGGSPHGVTPGAGFTTRAKTSSGTAFAEDMLSAASGSHRATATLASATDWYAVVAAFKPSS